MANSFMMPAFLDNILDNISTVTQTFVTDFVSTYWPWILGILGVIAIAGLVKRMIKSTLGA